ncbi:hypothetical protein BGZ99_007393 [Dissophora globulifera]|uniref:Uncharacterized protein n=1 Tax=Dissophora globulifera TaxID=979702 RepID=A0A9P6RS19_9FUNG|nr:hypothetical protein BGZ99_007393 [Dissophora globulifera]
MRQRQEGILQTALQATEDQAEDGWRLKQSLRGERVEVQDSISNAGHNSKTAQATKGSTECSNTTGNGKDSRSLDEMSAERLWEFVVGWCLIGCVFIGAALMVGANFRAQSGLSIETPWTFDNEDGDSLMDSVVAHVMRVTLGIKDFGDQLMEHGIFVFVVGINGFVLVRQRVFVRRRLYEDDILHRGVISKEHDNEGHDWDEEQRAGTLSSGAQIDEYKTTVGNMVTTVAVKSGASEVDPRIDDHTTTSAHKNSRNSSRSSSSSGGSGGGDGGDGGDIEQISDTASYQRPSVCSNTKGAQVLNEIDGSGTPDFGTMSFVAWFNYLQVGILIIEFLQLFSFPLRELMEFYNQAEKTAVMYESAKTVLNVLGAASSTSDRTTESQNSKLQYRDGILSFNNYTLFNFDLLDINSSEHNTGINETKLYNEIPSAIEKRTSSLNQSSAEGWLLNMPALDNATALATPWIGNITASTGWIAENLPLWLPNITALMANATFTAAAQESLEEIRHGLVRTAAGLVLQGHSSPGVNSTNLINPSTENGNHTATYSPKQVTTDNDIIMQVVNSLGLQPSINTHDCTFLSSAACQSQAIHAYAYERLAHQQEQARRDGREILQASSIFGSIATTLLDPVSAVAPAASSLLCTGPQIQPQLYLAFSLLAYTLAYVLFTVFLTSFERVPGKGEICFRPNGVAVLKNLGLLLAVDYLLIQSPTQRRFRGLVSMAIMLAMACYTIQMKPCYWNKINYWRTFSFSCVLYASLLVALLCPSPEPDKVRGERIGGRWVMAPRLTMGHAWAVGGGPRVMLAWIAAGWVILVIVFIGADKVFLRHWTKKTLTDSPENFSQGTRMEPLSHRNRPEASVMRRDEPHDLHNS